MAASQETLRRVKEKYPEYRDIPDAELSGVLIAKYPEYDEAPVSGSGATQDPALQQQDALRQQFVAQQQLPASEKIYQGLQGAGSMIGALAQPLVELYKGGKALPDVLVSPETVLPTVAETGRQLGGRAIDLARMVSPMTLADMIIRGPANALVSRGLQSLKPRTPSENEIEEFLAQQQFEQELQKEFAKPSFEGANVDVAKGGATLAEIVAPTPKGIREIKALTGGVTPKSTIQRLFRASIKPKAAVGERVELAAKNTLSDVFHANPNADKIAAIPFEGYAQTLKQLSVDTGKEMDAGLRQAGFAGNAGDEMAQEMLKRADGLDAAGRGDLAASLREAAALKAGKITTMEPLREATTLANRELTPNFQRAREMVNPKLAQAETIINQIIAKVGGDFENKALASLKGPDGLKLRKKWSDLNLLQQQADVRLNKLINSAPAELRNPVVEAVTSFEGAVGLVGLMNGFKSGAIPLVTAMAKKWARSVEKQLQDSNSLITRAYNELRKNPPPRPSRTPPLLPEAMPIHRSV